MRSTFAIALATISAALFTSLPGVQAEDYRVLVNYGGNRTPTDFCNQWRCACVNYVPQDKNLILDYTYCQPGNFQGKNQNSQATVYCTFKNGNNVQPVNKHIAAATGATLQ